MIKAAMEIELIIFVLRLERNAMIITTAINVARNTEGGTPVKNIKANNPRIVSIDRG
jgi:hypothetical protein